MELAKVDIVVPVLNEAHVLERSIAALRAFLRQHVPAARIVIADNGSTDGTLEVARRISQWCPDVSVIHLAERGRGRAVRRAWLGSDADVLCYMDVDLSTDLSALPALLAAVSTGGYDLATGSRLMKESKVKRSAKREFLSQVYNRIVRLVFGTHFSDAQCGFKAVTRKAAALIVPQVEDEHWFFDTEMLVLAEAHGLRIQDIPAAWVEDPDTRVKILATTWDDLKGIVRLRWSLSRRRPLPASIPVAEVTRQQP